MKATIIIVMLIGLLFVTLALSSADSVITTALPSQSPAAQASSVWQTATPESQGMSKAKLDALKDVIAARNTKAFLVIRNDRIVFEWYSEDHGPTKKHGTASLAKAIVGGLSLALAMTDGKIAIDDRAAKFIAQWKDDPQKSKITIRHLGSHTSGLSDSTTKGVQHTDQPGWMGDFWKRLDPPNDPFTIARDKTPALFAPGAKLQYSNPGIALLTYCVTAAIRDGAHKDIRMLLGERVLRPIGVPDEEWSVGYGKTFTVDGLPLVGSWGGGNFTARAVARIGRLVLRQGDWDGKRILSKEAIRRMTGDAGLPGHCGMGWWTNASGRYAGLPKDAVWGAGAGDQLLLVIPSLNLIMVRNGQTLVPPPPNAPDVFAEFHDPRAKLLFEPLVEAITDTPRTVSAPYPPSPVIRRVEWAAKETIIRRAKGGDNWPMTWADDDALYTAYGDGNGFEPFIAEKLSMGFARITGAPPNFSGDNIRAPSGETRGDGPAGKKASGMLMVEGVLYLWARNAANSQLAWSHDHGATWTWADWRFTESFGCPTFLNFGKNYAGARDEFVYVYSPDGNSAYETTDHLVLARVPKTQLREREAYRFFAGLDSNGRPRWTPEIVQRGAVFTHPRHCYRTSVTYNAALRRYMLVQALANAASRDGAGKLDVRFSGGLAIYDAPEPWGPWTTVFLTRQWDVGPGESASFPTKWISVDGKTLHLVFSGDDYFSVRRAVITTARIPASVSRFSPSSP
ncbi:MAG: serine hydrolase [Acidobacteria bacterium]|nr:serine hydrolase [Acidobacteriota bacterium]